MGSIDYPRLTVKESLSLQKRHGAKLDTDCTFDTDHFSENGNDSGGVFFCPRKHPSLTLLPSTLSPSTEEITLRDESGLDDYDDEEENFAATRFIGESAATHLSAAAHSIKSSTKGISHA